MSVDSAVLRDLFRRAADLSATDRDHFLSTLNEETRSALNALLESGREAEVFFERILDDARPPLSKAGQRFGPYEIRELIGQGGMGAVFRAERVDGEFRQVVALKIIERAWLNPRITDRFRQEREFLAGLEHANIARLVDGGTRADGIPYLAMEYVEGVPLDVYCKEHRLTIAARLRLFLPLCDAVDSAHQRLIVHRDLKPSNVLITSAGEPKLLDFGIAKALDEGGDGTHTLVFTPDFASPEQARGEAATTATDVYGLGAVLYFMLVGRAPHTVTATSPAEINKQITETAVARPSSIVPELDGDLDNILFKSLHRDPRRRYRSAREFAEDVGRHLSHRPVLATPDSFSYRTRRFLQRHTIASLAAGLAIVATISGTAAALYQARRAEMRFAQVRTLSNRFVFDFEAAIRDLPGSLAARRMVASTAREYLASLAEDAKHDPSLNGELAEAYYRLSRVESSAGESAQATDHLRKTIDLLKYSKGDCCGTPAQRSRYISATADLARFEDDSGRMETAPVLAAEAVRAARAWVLQSPADEIAARSLATALVTEGSVLSGTAKSPQARADLEEATRIDSDLLAHHTDDQDIAWERARAGQFLATVTSRMGEYGKALQRVDESKAVLDRLIAAHPQNSTYRQLRANMATSAGSLYRRLAEKDPSLRPKVLESAREAYELARTNVRLNPGDKSLLDSGLVMTVRLANQLNRDGRPQEALQYMLEAAATADELLKSDPANYRNQYLYANNRAGLADLLVSMKRWNEAGRKNDEALDALDQILVQRPSDRLVIDTKIGCLTNRMIIDRNTGRLAAARETCVRAMKIAVDLIALDKNETHSLSSLGELRNQAKLLGVTDLTAASVH